MKKSQLTSLIKEIVKNYNPERTTSPNSPDVIPDTRPKTPTRRRTLTPPKEAPSTRPKAKSKNEITDKIVDRFLHLKK